MLTVALTALLLPAVGLASMLVADWYCQLVHPAPVSYRMVRRRPPVRPVLIPLPRPPVLTPAPECLPHLPWSV